ncbi:thiamine phosphate synthase [Oceanobacillus iheyensis]|uniref:Thiamine-phosphate synthase n=1 Tax=Oceanobacillus iheyensis (strain DSM 14371 / CIP 107618 / JCM 11309 / KCTC 3954 / HTE831) TaxID=221109 RepID=THIE_OCEIH|nr:thiamine phosphate synthase [Oceanobacillus iheyensis]Q8ESZ3.1 RecName: Full=Thiamine-phosphate synthase; Short=TP synthase; Short=TPS; AltName: Full=Thiamine-phosphate pyrophosphorylase; Short=TMP pyrophosphorylase; Short=TMP-PPase [Oceanobacillus iheyensis HTE831]BAC12428.1 thiamine phosphate synthase chain B [Oceanobacillus iheyensis HTE831]
MKFDKHMLRKYFIMGSQNCHRDPREILKEAASAGITAFQYREKGKNSLTGTAKVELAKDLKAICHDFQIPFIINDDVDLAKQLDADGIHIGQDDQPVEVVRKQFPNKIIGLSISTNNELNQSPLDLVDYIGVGPIFDTNTKEDAKTAVGLEWIQSLKKQHPSLPLVAIGGINTTNAQEIIQAGADGVSFISAITETDHILQAVQRL